MVAIYRKVVIKGLSTEEKPTTNIAANTEFVETDTDKRFKWTGAAWIEMAGGGGGDMYKAVYDTNDDGVVDGAENALNSLLLEGSTKAQVQDHAPKAHTHPESDVTNLIADLAGKLPTTAFSGLAKITVSATEPPSPGVGDLWVDTS